MYVFVRKDLSTPQQAVQSSHACIEASRAFLAGADEHPSVIIFGIKSEPKLKDIANRLTEAGVRHRIFVEPDIGHQWTAIATEPVCGERRAIFSKYTLLQA
jgi:hypothetical protein